MIMILFKVLPPVPPLPFTLTAIDRCDLCNARAYIRVLVTVHYPELLFCAHHGHEMEAALRSMALDFVDESAAIPK